MKKFLLVPSLLLLLTACKPKNVKLLLNLDEGKTYYYTLTQSVSLQQLVNKQTYKMSTNVGVRYAFKVLKATDSVYKMEVHYDSLMVEEKSQATFSSFIFNSGDHDQRSPISIIFSTLSKQPFKLDMTNKGKILKIENTAKNIETAINSYPNMPLLAREQAKTIFTKLAGDDAFHKNIETWLDINPGKPLNEGDKWHKKKTMGGTIPVLADINYQLIAIKDDGFNIKATAKLGQPDTTTFIFNNGVWGKYNLPGEMIINYTLDEDTHWITSASFTQDVKGTIEVRSAKPNTPNMLIPVTYTSLGSINNK